MEIVSQLIVGFLKSKDSNTYTSEIDHLIRHGKLQNHQTGLLYGFINPKKDNFPRKCIVLCYGAGSVYSAYESIRKNSDLDITVMVFQYFGKYRSNRRNRSDQSDYFDSIQTAIEISKNEQNYDIRLVGHSLGCCGVARFTTERALLLCPFNESTDSLCISDGTETELETVRYLPNSKFIVLFGKSDYYISIKTQQLFMKSSNCRVLFYEGDHYLENIPKLAVLFRILFQLD